jgi:glycosyltransferase involved in cell wall biosynthesis
MSAEASDRHFVRESDASAEKSDDIALSYGCDYACSHDSGLYEAIGRGLDDACASGADVLGWLNADEQYLPDALETVRSTFESRPDVDLVSGDYLLLDKDCNVVSARKEIPARLFYLRHGVNYLLSCTVFFRSRVWRESGGFDRSYKLLGDKKFYMQAMTSGVTGYHIPRFLGAFGVTGNNASLKSSAPAEQARLRAEFGAFRAGWARGLVRGCRCAEKLMRGCYGRREISTRLYKPDGTSREFRGRVGSDWRWS